MIKTSLIVAGCLSFSTAFTQTTTNHIEIVVSESVELKPKEADIRVFVESAENQRNQKFYNYESSEYYYDSEWYGESEEDYMYEKLMSENPKKVTKKMKEEYEARQKQREDDLAAMRNERRERERQNELELASFVPFYAADMMTLLTENNISFTIVDNNSDANDFARKHLEYRMSSDYEREIYYNDTVLSIKMNDSKAYQNLIYLTSDLPAYLATSNTIFETIETIYPVVIPKLTEKATNEARTLANSFGRKLGKVIQCSNVYPYTPSSNYTIPYMDRYRNTDDNREGDPFLSTKIEVVEYIYRFELLN